MYVPTFLLVTYLSAAFAQLTAQSSVAPELRECYTDITLLNRNNLPPTTIQVLIDIIRKIEDNPSVNLNLRELAALLLHTYRQDGIEFHQPEGNLAMSSMVLPYAPTFHSFYRHKLLLTRLIPSNLQVLGNNTVPPVLKCALHHMLSTTVDARLRGDESNCNQLSQYRALRTARQVRPIKDDVEILDTSFARSANKNGQMRQYNPNDDVEFAEFGSTKSERQVLGESQCPILDGVIRTPWGAVSAGNLIAGIAAGAENQQVPILELAKGSVLNNNYPNIQDRVTSIYPATLSGDLAEAVLIQGTERGSQSIVIGAAGSWNSTEATKHYMIHSRINIEMTDPEIRGDIDGFVLGTTLNTVQGTYSSLKLSQLLDMYYSPRNGVFNPSLRACQRRELTQQYIINTNLVSETYTFAAALDTNMPLRGTITSGLQELVSNAVTNFQSYASSNLNDLTCIITETTSSDQRTKTNLYLVIDSTWQYEAVYPAVSYILDVIEVGKFGSSVTLLNAFDGGVIVNKTYSLSDFHTEYTLATHQSVMPGVNLQTTFANIRTLMRAELEYEKTINYVGGNSSVLLLLLNAGNIPNNEGTLNEARLLNETVPDLRILFATSTNQLDNLWNLVRDMHNDIRTVSLTVSGTNLDTAVGPTATRIQEVGRRIINPNCGSQFNGDASGTRQFNDYIEPGYINFYSISPNYFYGNHDNRKIRVSRTGALVGSLVICHSRVVQQPRQNATIAGIDENAVTCQTLATSGNIEIGLQNPCDGYSTINSCPFFYISVQSVARDLTSLSATCTETSRCRFPYNIMYQIQIEDLGCYSGSTSIAAKVFVIFFALLFTVLN